MYKCCTCGKNVPEQSIIHNEERLFDCPHCNNQGLGQTIRKLPEKKLVWVYKTRSGNECKRWEELKGVILLTRHQEVREDWKIWDLV